MTLPRTIFRRISTVEMTYLSELKMGHLIKYNTKNTSQHTIANKNFNEIFACKTDRQHGHAVFVY